MHTLWRLDEPASAFHSDDEPASASFTLIVTGLHNDFGAYAIPQPSIGTDQPMRTGAVRSVMKLTVSSVIMALILFTICSSNLVLVAYKDHVSKYVASSQLFLMLAHPSLLIGVALFCTSLVCLFCIVAVLLLVAQFIYLSLRNGSTQLSLPPPSPPPPSAVVWRQAFAQLLSRLSNELPPEALSPLRIAFQLGGASSIKDFFACAEVSCLFNSNAPQAKIIMLAVTLNSVCASNPVVVTLNRKIIECFPACASQIENAAEEVHHT